MKNIIYLNLFINLIIVGYLIYKHNRLYISINKTFWLKKVKSITFWWRVYKDEYGSMSKSLLTIRISNKKIDEWDSNEFKRLNDNHNFKK